MKVEYDHCKVELDPFRKYPNANYVELLQYLHVPLTFTTTILGSTGLMHETLAELYQFGVYNMKGEIISQGVYKYPGDPDLYPLMKATDDLGRTIYFYPHDILGMIEEDGSQFITRID